VHSRSDATNPLPIAVVAAAGFRVTKIDGKSVCLASDAISESRSGCAASYHFGSLQGAQRVPSKSLPFDVRLGDTLLAAFAWRRRDVDEAVRLYKWIREFGPRPPRPLPLVGARRIPNLLWFLGVVFGLRLLRGSADRFAARHSELFVVCYYDTRCLALVRAFRSQGKPVWDVQHGVIGKLHPSYSTRGMWTTGATESWLTPTSILALSEEDARYIRSELGCHAEARWFSDRYYLDRSSPTDALVTRPRILVTLQRGIPIPKEVLSAIRNVDEADWVIRAHPREAQKSAQEPVLRELSGCNHVQFEPPGTPLVLSLSQSAVHVTCHSSVVLEAAQEGVTSVCWCGVAQRMYAKQFAEGKAILVLPVNLGTHLKALLIRSAEHMPPRTQPVEKL
jgi:hypothetical protein